jgi:hypothetical protein
MLQKFTGMFSHEEITCISTILNSPESHCYTRLQDSFKNSREYVTVHHNQLMPVSVSICYFSPSNFNSLCRQWVRIYSAVSDCCYIVVKISGSFPSNGSALAFQCISSGIDIIRQNSDHFHNHNSMHNFLYMFVAIIQQILDRLTEVNQRRLLCWGCLFFQCIIF